MKDVFAGGLAAFEDADGAIDYEAEEEAAGDLFCTVDDGFDRDAYDSAFAKIVEGADGDGEDGGAAEGQEAPAPAPAAAPAPRPSGRPARTPAGQDPVAEILGDVGGVVEAWMRERDERHATEVADLEAKIAERDERIAQLAADLASARGDAAQAKADLAVALDRVRCIRSAVTMPDGSVAETLKALDRIGEGR